jgi:hypothetical protein
MSDSIRAAINRARVAVLNLVAKQELHEALDPDHGDPFGTTSTKFPIPNLVKIVTQIEKVALELDFDERDNLETKVSDALFLAVSSTSSKSLERVMEAFRQFYKSN